MLRYAIRRLLLVPPTFFLISLVIFLVLNLAPGRPGEANRGDAGESGDDASLQETYRIFKEQFSLDKPILLNTRFLLTQDETRALLVTAYGIGIQPTTAQRQAAADRLDDLGNDLVRHLVPLLDDGEPEVARVAAVRLVRASQLRFVGGDDEAARAQNRVLRARNEAVKGWSWAPDASAEEVAEVSSAWQAWYGEHRADYEYTAGEQAWSLFFDTRFAKYWGNLIRLDFGVSIVDRRPVLDTVFSKLKYSLSLTVVSVLLAYTIAVPLGIFSAANQGTRVDGALSLVLFMMYSLPTFFTGTVLLRLLSEGDPVAWFPTGGFASMDQVSRTTLDQLRDIGWHLVLPVATYTSVSLAALSRYARAGVIEVIRADYIRTARAKGLSEPVVLVKHAARNGMIPILTLLGGLLPALVGGSVVIEVIFDIPGMGRFLFDSIGLRDYNAVMAVLLTSAVLTQVGILLSDLSYAVVDPRISLD